MVFIFSYNREEMLRGILNNVAGEDVYIMDDGSDFTVPGTKTIKMAHGGKERFWEKWFVALRIAEGSSDDMFVFTVDDFMDLDMARIKAAHRRFRSSPYVHHIINDGRESCWGSPMQKPLDVSTIRCHFVDCAFFCNRSALRAIGWHIKEVPLRRFHGRKHGLSSGVGQNLTYAFMAKRVPIYKPVRSMAYHGSHLSKMHPGHREGTPLISL